MIELIFTCGGCGDTDTINATVKYDRNFIPEGWETYEDQIFCGDCSIQIRLAVRDVLRELWKR